MKFSSVLFSIFCLFLLCIAARNVYAQEYKGSQYCLNCHANPMGDKRAVGDMILNFHNTSLRDPDRPSFYGPPGVVNHDQWVAGLDLATTDAFEKYGENAPKLSFDQTYAPQDSTDLLSGYRVTIGSISYMVNFTYGGHDKWKQRYVTKTGESNYILPIQWNENTQEWVTYSPDNWYDENNLPLYTDEAALAADIEKKDSFERRCIGCHSTGVELAYDEVNGYTSTYSELNTTCERCHGAAGTVSVSAHFGGTGIAPSELTKDQDLELCGQCHSRGTSLGTAGGNTFDFPVNDALETYKIGDDLADYFVVYNMENGASKFWPDGTSKSHHQQYIDFKNSEHYANPEFPGGCSVCHDPHQAPGDHQVRDEIEQTGADGNPLVITTENDNNTICLACHATDHPFEEISKEMVADLAANMDAIGAVVSEHTYHAYDPDGTGESRCSKCHMPKMAKSAIDNDIHAHTFEAILPEKTLMYQDEGGMPNSCALSCHNASNPWNIVDATSTDWSESSDVALATALDEYVQQWWPAPLLCDINENGIINIADVIALLLFQRANPDDLAGDINGNGTSNISDAIFLLIHIMDGTCSDASVLLASAVENGYLQVGKIEGLTESDIEYIEQMMAQMDLTEEQEAAFRVVLYGKAGSAGLPKAFSLAQNSPNPFNPATTISYSVPEGNSVHVRLDIFGIRGRLVRTLVDADRDVGNYTVFWDGTDRQGRKVSSGVYFYRMRAGSFAQTRKMVLLK